MLLAKRRKSLERKIPRNTALTQLTRPPTFPSLWLFKDSRQFKGLVLVNPATSYDRSHWRVVGSLVANAPGLGAFGMAATLTLATTVPDTSMVSTFRIFVGRCRHAIGHIFRSARIHAVKKMCIDRLIVFVTTLFCGLVYPGFKVLARA